MVNGRNELLISIGATARDFNRAINEVSEKTKELQSNLRTISRRSAIAFTAIAGVAGAVLKVFSDYETALVGLGKTTDIVGDDLKNLGNEFRGLARELPVPVTELLNLGQIAGQLGVRGNENILRFTRTVAQLGRTTNLSAETAATEMARLLNITGDGIETIDTFGSVLVRLGNEFEANEDEILRVASEVAKATSVFQISADEVLGIATALKSLGIEAQVGGSSVGRTFRAIDDAIRAGGRSISDLADITGIAVQDLEHQFDIDRTGVFLRFIQGLSRIQEEGGNVAQELNRFQLQGLQLLKVIPTLATSSDKLATALKTAGDEAQDGAALQKEFEAASRTLASRFTILRNNINDAAIELGNEFAPAALDLINNVNDLVSSFRNVDDSTKDFIISLFAAVGSVAGVVTVLTGLAGAFLGVATVVKGTITALAGPAALTGILGLIASPVGVVVLATAAVAGLTAAFVDLRQATRDNEKPIQELQEEIDQLRKKREELQNTLNNELSQNVQIQRVRRVEIESRGREIAQLDDQIAKLEELQRARESEAGSGVLEQEPVQRPEDFLPRLIPEETPLFFNREEIDKQAQDALDAFNEGLERIREQERLANERLAKDRAEENERRLDMQLSAQEKERFEQELFRLLTEEQQKQFNSRIRTIIREDNDTRREIQQAYRDQQEEFLNQDAERRLLLEEITGQTIQQLRRQFNSLEIEELLKQIKTKEEIERKAELKRIGEKNKANQRFIDQEKKFGTTIANIDKVLRSEQLQGAKQGLDQLTSLTASKNKDLFNIGRAASIARAIISTAEGAHAAYTGFAIAIPGPVGIALGSAAAAAVVAQGAQTIAEIQNTQFQGVAGQRGGIVPEIPGGASGLRDRTPALLEPGELIVPRPLVPDFVQSAGIPEPDRDDELRAEDEDEGTPVIMVELEDRAAEVITLQQREGRALGIIAE